jgi:diguanylate cyclase (GGDEF)-like protein
VGDVPLTAGLPVAALACVAAAVLGVGLLGRSAVRAGTALRSAYHRFALGIGVAVFGFATTALLADGGWRSDTPAQLGPCAVGLGLGTALLASGLLRLPAVAADRAAALGLALDGGLLSGCALLVGWTLVAQPALTREAEQAGLHDPRTLLLGVPLLVALTVVGIVTVVVVRGRRAVAGPAVATGFAALTGYAALLALRYGDGTAVVALGCAYALALLACALTVLGNPRLARPVAALGMVGVLLAVVPASAAIAAIVTRVLRFGGIDNVSVVIVAVIGVLITARQLAAASASHRYAQRLAEREAYFKEMAFTDALTGLGNRRRLMRTLYDDAVGGPPAVLLAIDLDGFKNVNDVRGHDVGDAVLVEVGRRLRGNLRPGDIAARLGGDEFAVVMWAGPDEAYRVAERLLRVLSEGYPVDGTSVYLSSSIGLAGDGVVTDVPRLLHNADLALRFAKQRGKNRVERYDAAYDRWMHRRTALEQELRGAIEREELSLAYQPVMALPDGRPVGVEALLRWYHPTLGAVPAREFIPVAEEFGLIGRIDRWVLHQACHQLSRWMADGHDPWLSVNISVRELHLPEYVAQLVEVLRAHRVPAGRLVLEVTEHAVAIDLAEVVERLAELRAHGVRIALDDFGAGYSSLGQLRRMPVDLIKIDKGLVADPSAPLIGVVVTLGEQLGLEVVAEGVSTPAQRAIVAAAGCRLVQGELSGAPMPAEHIEALIARPFLVPAPPPAQDMGQVDSGHEMRQS